MGRQLRGFTLVEMMITISVATILTVVAVPNMQSMVKRRQLEGAATEVYANLLLMRSQAIEKNRSTYVAFSGSGTAWTYGLSDRTDQVGCTPATPNSCLVNAAERVYGGSTWKSVTLTQNFSGSRLTFDSRRGFASSSGLVRLTSSAGQIDVTVSPIGYVSACSPTRLGGFSTC